MTRKVTSDSKIQEVFKYAGKKLLVIHFYDKERHCKGLRLKNSGGSFYLAEINKLPDYPDNKEQIKSTNKLIDKYMPASVTRLVFFRNGKRVRFEETNQEIQNILKVFFRLTMNGLSGQMMITSQPSFWDQKDWKLIKILMWFYLFM